MINVLNNTLEEVPEPEVSCKFLTDRTSANSLSFNFGSCWHKEIRKK